MADQPAAATPAPAAPAAPAAPPTAPPAEAAKPGAAPPPPPAEKPAEKDPAASAFARLAASERALKAERAKLEEERKAFLAERTKTAAGVDSLKAKVQAGDYDAVAKELGLSYKEWSKRLIEQGSKKPSAPEPVDVAKVVDERVREIVAQQQAEQESRMWGAAWTAFGELVTPEASGYDLLRAEIGDNPELVEQTLKEMARLDPRLDLKGAAERYEAHLLDQLKRRSQIGKVKALFAPEPVTPAKKEEKQAPREGTGSAVSDAPRSPTLTNSLAATPASGRDQTPRPDSPVSRVRAKREAEKDAERRMLARLNQG